MKDLMVDYTIILGRRLNNGFIRNGHNVLSISDRDIIHNNKGLKIYLEKNHYNQKLLNTFNNFKPDIIVLGHADIVYHKHTLRKLKEIIKIQKFVNGF